MNFYNGYLTFIVIEFLFFFNKMQKAALFSSFFWGPGFWVLLNAQSVQFVMTGTDCRVKTIGSSCHLTLCNADWNNNVGANGFVPGTGTVVFSGSTFNNAITGTSTGDSTQFANLWVNKTGRELQLERNISVSQICSLVNGNMNLQNARLNLTTEGSILGEDYASGKKIYCPDNSLGHIRAQRLLAAGNAYSDIAGLGISLNLTPGGAPGNTVILRGHDRQTSTATGFTGVGRYYDIYPTVSSGYTYTMVFTYQDAELAGMPEENMALYRSASHGTNTADWELTGFGASVHNPSANTITLAGLSTFSRWTTSNVSVAPLPIELDNFYAECVDNGVTLYWTTVSEVNNESFSVEHSGDLQNWEWVGLKPGSGNSNQLLHYTLHDERQVQGLRYYRLTQADYNGNHETFPPIAVECAYPDLGNGFSVFPNPTSGVFTLLFPDFPSTGLAELRIIDMKGGSLMRKELLLTSDNKEYALDVTGLLPGVYMAQVQLPAGKLMPIKLIIN